MEFPFTGDAVVGEEIALDDQRRLSNAEKTWYEVVSVTNPNRCLVRYDGGLIVVCERGADSTWSLGGDPDAAEQATIEALMPARDTTKVDVTHDS